MPDDRYQWLDEEAAERMLRGLAADGCEEERGTSPQELARALDALFAESVGGARMERADRSDDAATGARISGPRTFDLPDKPMAGEDEAVAAFRAAQNGVLRSGSVAAVGASAVEPGTSRGRSVRGFFSALTARPVGAGLAAAIAACALGGVAVAAGTGVIPTPFGGGGGAGAPTPMVSVSSDAPGERHGDGGRGPRSGSPSASTSPDRKLPGAPSKDGKPGPDGTRSPEGPLGGVRGEDGLSARQKKALALALCDAYETGRLGLVDQRKLERAAGGADRVRTFCERLAGGAPDDGAVGTGGSSNSGGSGGGNSGGGDSGGSGGGDTGGSAGGDAGGSGDDSGGYSGGDSGGTGDGGSGSDGGGDGGPGGGDGSLTEGRNGGADTSGGGDGGGQEEPSSPSSDAPSARDAAEAGQLAAR